MEYTPITKRTKLIEKLPLDTPFGIHICPTTYCNFKCFYCKHSQEDFGIDKSYMDIDLFQKIINQIKEFPNKLKLLNFAWLGEPLLHPDIAKMVRIAKKANIAERVEIVSNGSMITKELGESLVDAGLDRIRISLQGLSAEEYLNVSGYKLSFDKFVDNLKRFYEYSVESARGGRAKTRIYIKIMDSMIQEIGAEQKYNSIFSDICDELNIETLIPLATGIDLSEKKKTFEKGYWGNDIKEVNICPQIFYTQVITPLGNVLPCCEIGEELVIGNVNSESIKNIWNGEKLREFRKNMITNGRLSYDSCKNCGVAAYQTSEEDYLDDKKEILEERYIKD